MIVLMLMYIPNICFDEECSNPVAENSDFCFLHLEKERAEKLKSEIEKELNGENKFVNKNFSLIDFKNFNFNNKNFYSTIFTKATFRNCTFNNSQFHLTFFNEAFFENCTFKNSFFNYTLFTDSVLKNCKFEESDIILTNLMGVHSVKSIFTDCDLYLSTFYAGKFENTKFENCNLKKTNFQKISNLEDIIFKTSNSNSAIFDI